MIQQKKVNIVFSQYITAIVGVASRHHENFVRVFGEYKCFNPNTLYPPPPAEMLMSAHTGTSIVSNFPSILDSWKLTEKGQWANSRADVDIHVKGIYRKNPYTYTDIFAIIEICGTVSESDATDYYIRWPEKEGNTIWISL